jgi:thiol peroxidase
VHEGLPRKATAWAAVTLPPNAAVTVEEGTTAQRSEPALSDGAGVEVAEAELEGDAAADGRGDADEQAARPGSRRATATPAAPRERPLSRKRNRMDTMLADSRRTGNGCQGGPGRVTAMSEERTGEAFELGEHLTVVGSKLRPGDPAPDFALDHFDGDTVTTVSLADTAGRVRLLSVVNSLDTPVCDIQTRRWESETPEGVVVYTISMDLPFAQQRWISEAGAAHAALSSHRSEDFGTRYGVLIKEWRLLQRALFVVDGSGTIVHAEYVPDQMREPDYGAALAAARDAA